MFVKVLIPKQVDVKPYFNNPCLVKFSQYYGDNIWLLFNSYNFLIVNKDTNITNEVTKNKCCCDFEIISTVLENY